MKAFIVTVLIPHSWSQGDILSAINIGLRKYANEKCMTLAALDYHTQVIDKFELKEKP